MPLLLRGASASGAAAAAAPTAAATTTIARGSHQRRRTTRVLESLRRRSTMARAAVLVFAAVALAAATAAAAAAHHATPPVTATAHKQQQQQQQHDGRRRSLLQEKEERVQTDSTSSGGSSRQVKQQQEQQHERPFTTAVKPRPGPSAADAAADAALWRWLAAGGAAVNFKLGYSADGVRGGYATEDIPAGGVVAAVPMELTFRFPAKWRNFVSLGEYLAREAARPGSRWRPYLDSLPALRGGAPAAALSWESYPREYLHLLGGAAPLAERAVSMQAATQRFWARHGLRLLAGNVTLDALRAALVTITTRWYQGPDAGPDAGAMALIPAYDALNHRNGCPTHYDFAACPPPAPAGRRCVVVRTDAAIPAGAEVCNSYNHLTPDLALMHYGFLLPDEPPGALPALSAVDAHGFEGADLRRAHHEAPARFRGPAPALAAERARLAATIAALRQNDAAAARTPRAPSDADGSTLAMVLAWRRQRARALEAEVARLDKALARGGDEEAGGDAAAAGIVVSGTVM